MSAKSHLILHLRAKELTIFRDSLIWQLAALTFSAWGLGVGWGSGPLGAATRCPRRRRPFHFFRDLASFGESQDSGFAGQDDGRRTTDDGRNRAPPLKPPWFFEQKTATGNRNPISVFLRAKKVAVSKK